MKTETKQKYLKKTKYIKMIKITQCRNVIKGALWSNKVPHVSNELLED